MQAASNRTFICSVVFLDIVEYSKKPVAEQILFKERLNGLLTEALKDVPPNDRIILDTGDGAALSFLGDPEDALFACLSLRDALAGPQPAGPQLKMRIGVNLGPVKLVKDINGQPNIIGDGINVAQRVMSFATPGQVLASRSYYEVVSRLADDYVQLFHYEGSRTDKHVREHEVYAVQPTAVPIARPEHAKSRGATQSGPVVLDRLAQSASFVTVNLRSRPRLGTALAVVLILAVAVGLRVNRQPPAVPAEASGQPPSKVAAAPAPKAAAESPSAAPSGEKPAAKAARKPATPPAPATAARPPVTREQAATAESGPSASGSPGTVAFTVSPWGEVYIDGRHVGTVPPLYKLSVSAGRHRVEIQHPDFPTHVRTIEVRPGRELAVSHWFLPKEQPNPLQRLFK